MILAGGTSTGFALRTRTEVSRGHTQRLAHSRYSIPISWKHAKAGEEVVEALGWQRAGLPRLPGMNSQEINSWVRCLFLGAPDATWEVCLKETEVALSDTQPLVLLSGKTGPLGPGVHCSYHQHCSSMK